MPTKTKQKMPTTLKKSTVKLQTNGLNIALACLAIQAQANLAKTP